MAGHDWEVITTLVGFIVTLLGGIITYLLGQIRSRDDTIKDLTKSLESGNEQNKTLANLYVTQLQDTRKAGR